MFSDEIFSSSLFFVDSLATSTALSILETESVILPTDNIIVSPADRVDDITVSIVEFILPIFVLILFTLTRACSLAPLFSSAAVAICSIDDFNCSIALTLS